MTGVNVHMLFRAREEREMVAAMIDSKATSSNEKVKVIVGSSPVGSRKKMCAQSRANGTQVSQDPSLSHPPPLPPPGFEKKLDTITHEATASSNFEENKTGGGLLNESWPELVTGATATSPVRSSHTLQLPPKLNKKEAREGKLDTC